MLEANRNHKRVKKLDVEFLHFVKMREESMR